MVFQRSLHTPIGDLSIAEEGGMIVALSWGWSPQQADSPVLAQAVAELSAYFAMRLPGMQFHLPLAPQGTPFQQRVWLALCRLLPGETKAYSALAGELGTSPRALGQAVARNPIPIFIPCHRVVALHGLGGYSGGEGVATKRYLLELERTALRKQAPVGDATMERKG